MLICAVLYFINFCSFLYYILSSKFIGFTLLFFFIAFLYSSIHIEDYEFSSKYCCFCCWVANSCLTLWIPTDRSMPGFPIPHHHSEFAQVHNHGVGDAIQPSHPLLPSSASASVFHSIWVFSNELAVHTRWPKYWASALASVLPKSIQNWFPLGLSDLNFLFPKDSQESSPTPQFKSINYLALCLLYGPTLIAVRDYWKDHSLNYTDPCQQRDIFAF